ncbi:MAG TPA: hypothetical protein ENK20_12665 [Chromatiales bacterium]|nr:hypothetical protein [Chromatiales bacterium]
MGKNDQTRKEALKNTIFQGFPAARDGRGRARPPCAASGAWAEAGARDIASHAACGRARRWAATALRARAHGAMHMEVHGDTGKNQNGREAPWH